MLVLIYYHEQILVDKNYLSQDYNDELKQPSLVDIMKLKGIAPKLQYVIQTNDEFIAYTHDSEVHALLENNEDLTFVALRSILCNLDSTALYKALYYKSLIHYYQQKFCGYCGKALFQQTQNKFLYCNNCETEIYPHIAPSIIVRITRGDEILLARNVNFAKNIWSVLAGYVEIGETLEEAVHREVFEEVGLTITNLKYFGSQPWPFSGISLMVGFTAEYASGTIKLQEDEIIEAGFFGKNNLPGLPSSKASIAQKMIDDFISNT